MKLPACFIVILALLVSSSQAFDKAKFQPITRAMTKFPDSPSETDFHAIEAKMAALPKFLETDADDQHALLISAAFLIGGHDAHGWSFGSKSEVGKTALDIIAGKGKWGKWFHDDETVTADRIDVWWASYFASQDEWYLFKVLKYAGNPTSVKDLPQAVVIEEASFTFLSNCGQIHLVKDFARQRFDDPDYADKKAYLQSCLALNTANPPHPLPLK